ncbi:MAG: dTDP-4-amino-4,6-dideoxygalactose transaminase [Ilumatobacteraceae bacterium]
MIPFNRPTVAPGQLDLVAQAFASGHLSGDGELTKRAAALLSQIHNGSSVLLTTSCTAALELSALLLELSPGDEVIVPSFTFVSSANAFALMGARIVFVDIDPATLNLDATQALAAITPRTRAIVAVNYGGVPSVTDELISGASANGTVIIEDNAHGLFGSDRGTALGTRSALSTLSFHETKNVTCGEGGALVVNDSQFIERAEIIREKGTNRSRFFRGMVDKYTWMDVGSSYLLSDVNAGILCAQLDHRETIQSRRRSAACTYREQLADWADSNDVVMPHRAHSPGLPDHLFPLLFRDLDTRRRFLEHTRANGVATTFHYLPLHSSPAGERFGQTPFGCPVTTSVSDRLARLPLFSDITPNEVEIIVDVVRRFAT